MGAKRANNGIEPGIRVKGASGIALTNEEWARLAELEEELDATLGYLLREAARKTWLKGMVKR